VTPADARRRFGLTAAFGFGASTNSRHALPQSVRLVDLKIQDVAFGGKGVARNAGKAIFIPYTVDGETVRADIVREKKKFGEAELVEVLEASSERGRPECPYFGQCGGCAYQHISYAHQLELKWRQVRDLLQRIGKLETVPMRPMVPSSAPYGYRNRVTVHVEEGVIGFFRHDSHRLIDVERCPISSDEVNAELAQLRRTQPRDGHYTLRKHTGPRIFSQTNDFVAEALRKLVDSLLPARQDRLIDAYCGAGFFAKALLDKFQRIVGIDWDRFAIEEAKKSATEKETYIADDVEAALRKLVLETPSLPGSGAADRTAIIVDPPATGLGEKTRRAILDLAPKTFLYVSCNPATLARDLGTFVQAFDVRSVTPLDMFPQTAEIEIVAHLQARSAVSNDI
jgi:23S rRNA (uracil1939-C5)-methyltransferase